MNCNTKLDQAKLLVEEIIDKISDINLLVDCEIVEDYIRESTGVLDDLSDHLSQLKERENQLKVPRLY